MVIRIAGLEKESTVDGPGIRNVIFLQGCVNHCKGCHNPQTWDPDGGELVKLNTLFDEIDSWAKNPLIMGVTISGGDPFYFTTLLETNPKEFWYRLKMLTALFRYAAHKYYGDLIVYTGHTRGHILHPSLTKFLDYKEFLALPRYVITDPYIEEKRSVECLFRGSTNQTVHSFILDKDRRIKDVGLTQYWNNGDIETSNRYLESIAPEKFEQKYLNKRYKR